MREIKFRAWQKEAKSFVSAENTAILPYGEGFFIDSGAIHIAPDCDEFELMQYTGLKDRKGVEIYEGDIVEGSVGFGLAHLQVKWFGEGHGNCWYPFNHIRQGEHCEVIGNIYDGSTGD